MAVSQTNLTGARDFETLIGVLTIAQPWSYPQSRAYDQGSFRYAIVIALTTGRGRWCNLDVRS
jgi:hypothetical protein